MKKILFVVLLSLGALSACNRRCEVEPIVEENQRLIVPPGFGKRPQ